MASLGIVARRIVLCTLVAVVIWGAVEFGFDDAPQRSIVKNVIGDVKLTHLALEDEQKDELVRLGLTPRDPIRVETQDGQSQVIHGRFLHITDMHPDEFYKTGSDVEDACHHGKPKKKERIASKFGDAIKGCDAPLALVENTLKWCSENLKDKIDFVAWTGDNIRHDNDRRYPRLETDIFEMNEKMSDLMFKSFQDDDGEMRVKVVPNLGNNDVYPHNLFAPGPTLQTRELYQIWKDFIPSEQLHVFARGAYFFREIIPDRLAVVSINTLYLFRSNPLVDNCDGKKQPGYKLFEWLGVVLKEARARGMKVWLIGHVPPTPKNYDPTCLRKQVVWLYEYRDIIIGSLFGHMNIDHFIPLDSQKAYKSINKKLSAAGLKEDYFEVSSEFNADGDEEEEDDDFEDLDSLNEYLDISADDEIFGSEPHIMGGAPYNKVDYMDLIRDSFYSRVKGTRKRGAHSERYSIAHITVSVVPTFNPGVRVWEYNITGLFDEKPKNYKPWSQVFEEMEIELFPEENDLSTSEEEHDDEYLAPFMTEEKLVEILKKDKTFPPKMPSDIPLGPAYTPQTFSPERYVQYFVDLDEMNNLTEDEEGQFNYKVEYTTDDDAYKLKSLLVDDWIKFAKKLGEPVKSERKGQTGKSVEEEKVTKNKLTKLWRHYLERSFVKTGYEDMKDYN